MKLPEDSPLVRQTLRHCCEDRQQHLKAMPRKTNIVREQARVSIVALSDSSPRSSKPLITSVSEEDLAEEPAESLLRRYRAEVGSRKVREEDRGR